jgi:hypothetical protein
VAIESGRRRILEMTTLIASILWEKSHNRLSVMMLDKKTFAIVERPTELTINTVDEVPIALHKVLGILNKDDRKYELEYRVLGAASPASRSSTSKGASELSIKVLLGVVSFVAKGPHCTKYKQLRTKLSKDALDKFKAGLLDLSLITPKSAAWVWHLWSVAVHATKSNHEKVLKRLWARYTTPLPKRKEKDQAFREWYSQL